MLETVREPWKLSRAKKVVASVLFGLICVTFVFVGVTPDTGGGSSGTAATVNDRVISLMDFQDRISLMERQFGSQGNLPAAQRQMRDRMIRQSALEDLISYEVVSLSAEKAGIHPTAGAVRDLIVAQPAFQENGRFTRDLYDRYLTYKNMTASEFEKKISRELAVSQVRDVFMAALKTPKVVSQLENRARETKMNFEFAKIDNEVLGQWLKKSGTINDFARSPEGQDRMKKYYEANKAEFSTPVQVRARHILVKGTDSDSLKKIQEIKKEAAKGDFAELAKKYSQDEGSKDRGGDLNVFGKGQMVPEFEAAAFSLPINQVSEPVKTNFGYHLIKVESRQGGEVKPFSEVESQIAEKVLLDEQKEKKLAEVEKALKAGGDVQGALKGLGVSWQETGDVNLNQNYIPKVELEGESLTEVMALQKAGQVYPGLIRSGPSAYVFKLKKITEPDPAKLKSTDGPFSVGGSEALSQWADEKKKAAVIRRNSSLVQ